MTGDTTSTMIFDVEAQKMYSFDSKKKEADAGTCRRSPPRWQKSVEAAGIKASVKPNGKTKQLAGKTANGYDMESSVPAKMGGASGMKMTVMLTGPMWVVKGAPGTAEYVDVLQGRRREGLDLQRSARRQRHAGPGQGDGARCIASSPPPAACRTRQEMNVKMAGDGPMAAVFAKMGNISMTRPCSRWTRRDRRRAVRAAGRLQDQGAEIDQASLSSYLSLLQKWVIQCRRRELRPHGRSSKRPKAWTRGSIPITRSIADAPRRARHGHRSAVGAQEENNLRHLVTNLGDAVGRHKVMPFLTTKHSLEFCLAYADQAVHNGFPSLVVLGGDKHVGRPRFSSTRGSCAPDPPASPEPELGGWANPTRIPCARSTTCSSPMQRGFLPDADRVAPPGRRVMRSSSRPVQRPRDPGVFGVFYTAAPI